MNDKRKEYLKKWREDNKERIKNYKKEYAKTHDSSFKKLKDKYKQLQQENKILKENAENNDKVVELLKEKNERLKIQISVREEVCSRIASNWNLLKRYCYEVGNDENTKLNGLNVLDKMQELEQGSDSNVKD